MVHCRSENAAKWEALIQEALPGLADKIYMSTYAAAKKLLDSTWKLFEIEYQVEDQSKKQRQFANCLVM